MKHNYTLFGLFAAVALVFAVGCSKSDKDEVLLSQTQTETATEGERNYLYATIEDEESRTFVVDNRIICWHAGDMISAFCNTTYNSKYTFLGEDGDKGGMFYGSPTGGDRLEYFYALYPYNTRATMKVDGDITTTLPYFQSYAKDSFGKGANPMVAVATNSAQKLMFNNVCGYLKIKLYGNNVKIKYLVLQGNNGEKLSGAATISAPYGEKPAVTMAADATEKVMINCESGVTLGTTSEDATTFWFALPPTTFEKGITITAYTTDGLSFTKSTSNKVTITRNRIQPMGAVEVKDLVKASVPSNEIWYTSSNGKIVTPYKTNVFGATILFNAYEGNLGIITFDRPITSIGEDAFYNCTSLKSITIPDSVTSIGDAAFRGCTSLKSVTIGNSITSIGGNAFYYCTSLTSVTIGNSVTSIGGYAFEHCTSLTSVTIPDSVTSIGEYAFEFCRALTSVTIGNGVTSIEESAFWGCGNLKSVDISDLSAWCKINFYDTDSNPCHNGAKLFINGAEATKITIPSDITTIKFAAFYGCTSLTKVTIPDSVTEIGDYAFNNCDGLTSVTIGNSVTSIGGDAFYDCDALTRVTIPDSVTSIGNSAFYSCGALTSVTIGNSVTSIEKDAFYAGGNLKSVDISDLSAWCKINFYDTDSNPCHNGAKLFINGAEATKITIPSDITTIKFAAFYGCTSLASVTIPDSVTSIGNWAFSDCSSLKEVACRASTPPTGSDYMFDNNASGRKIYVPAGTESKYKSASYWSSYSSYIYGVIFTDENEPID